MTTARERRQRRERDVTAQIEGRYATQAMQLLREHNVRVCHWRSNMTGIAWLGLPDRIIEAPHPRSSLSFAILAHEVGHQALGKLRPRWREEQLAWDFALEQMERLGVPVSDAVQKRYAGSMRYALAKAIRRGMKEIPPELARFVSRDPFGA